MIKMDWKKSLDGNPEVGDKCVLLNPGCDETNWSCCNNNGYKENGIYKIVGIANKTDCQLKSKIDNVCSFNKKCFMVIK